MSDVPAALLRPFDFANLPYCCADSCSDTTCAETTIRQRRKALGGKLFIDRLLEFAQVDGPNLYPPSSPSGLRRLLTAINESDVDRLKRDCFVYYLARDADAAKGSKNGDMDVDVESPNVRRDTLAANFGRSRCLPLTWRTYMDGYWHLDHGNWDRAVECLRDPCLRDVDFASEIVNAITTQVSPPSHALELTDAFLASRVEKLSDEVETQAAFLSTASVAGMAAAFHKVRELSDEESREQAREALWCWALGAPRSPAGKGPHTAQPRALRELLHLPLSDEEHAHLVSFLAHPPREVTPAARSLLHDLVTLRLVHAGKYEETLALDHELAGTDAVLAGDRQRRREMVREFIDILPAAQRRILLGDCRSNEQQTEDVDMSASWVDVQKEADSEKEKKRKQEVEEKQKEQAKKKAEQQKSDVPVQPIAAPTPIRAPAVRNLQSTNTPSRAGASSPFGGPPRFPASPAIPTPRPAESGNTSPTKANVGLSTPSRSAASSPERVQPAFPTTPGASTSTTPAPAPASALPAALRPSPPRVNSSLFQAPASSSKPAPRKPKRVIDDTPRRSSRRRAETEDDEEAVIRAPSEPPIPEDVVAAPPVSTRRSRRTIVPPTPQPASDGGQTPTKRPARGRVSRASTVEPEPEDDPPIPGSFVSPSKPARATRKAAKAALEDPEPAPETKRPRGKTPVTRRTTRAMSEAMDDASAAAPPPVSTRTRRAAAASERGSPTPSVASSAASPTRTTRRTRTTRETSATPRATRSRKAKEK